MSTIAPDPFLCPSESTGEIMHNVVALETNPTSGTCCANFKNVVSAISEGWDGMGWNGVGALGWERWDGMG